MLAQLLAQSAVLSPQFELMQLLEANDAVLLRVRATVKQVEVAIGRSYCLVKVAYKLLELEKTPVEIVRKHFEKGADLVNDALVGSASCCFFLCLTSLFEHQMTPVTVLLAAYIVLTVSIRLQIYGSHYRRLLPLVMRHVRVLLLLLLLICHLMLMVRGRRH
jgi:hypothetical protein